MSEDYQTKNKSASIEKSIEYLNLFATDFIPKASLYSEEIQKKGIEMYRGPLNKDFKFDRNCNPNSEYIQTHLQVSFENGSPNILNQFEFFSAAMMSGLADEELAFVPLGKIYCKFVREMYVPICYLRREEDATNYSNTINLFNNWNARIEKLSLEKNRNKLDEQISEIQTSSIQSIWEAK